jgi:hypothetical protein
MAAIVDGGQRRGGVGRGGVGPPSGLRGRPQSGAASGGVGRAGAALADLAAAANARLLPRGAGEVADARRSPVARHVQKEDRPTPPRAGASAAVPVSSQDGDIEADAAATLATIPTARPFKLRTTGPIELTEATLTRVMLAYG